MSKSVNVVIVILIFFLIFETVFGVELFDPKDALDVQSDGSTTLDSATRGVWEIIRLIVNILSIGVFIYTGIRYMMASADQKADIKKSLLPLAIGAIIVFASITFIDFIQAVAKEIFG